MEQFFIDEQYLTSVVITETWNYLKNKEDKTEEDMIYILKGEGIISCRRDIDHPEFTKLREELGKNNFIKIERNWWNGDVVLKPFKLNYHIFKPSDKFCCASAMKYDIIKSREKYEKKNKNKS